jgi:outer membrane protein TolC
MKAISLLSAIICLLYGPVILRAQQDMRASQSSELQLGPLQRAAIESDPRFRQLQLQQAQSALRLENLAAEKRPAIGVEGLAQYQSDVPTPPPFLPGGQPLFLPPKGTVDASVRVDQYILDPTIDSRKAVEQAQLDEGQARVRSALFGLRQDVNDAFFAAALLQERSRALAATIAELETRLTETNARVREGTALAADADAVEATLLQRRQDADALQADRTTALKRLSDLTGRAISEDDVFVMPDLKSSVTEAMAAAKPVRARPEYEQFLRTQARLARQQDAASALERPQLSAFARGGVGRPGLNFISDAFEAYALGGFQLRWKAWTWGSAGREREALGIQQEIVAADEAAFTRGLDRAIEGDRATIDRLERAVTLDDHIVELRDAVARTTEIRFREGTVTASEYLDRSTDLLLARYARAGHRVELAQASARFLTTLGLEVR